MFMCMCAPRMYVHVCAREMHVCAQECVHACVYMNAHAHALCTLLCVCMCVHRPHLCPSHPSRAGHQAGTPRLSLGSCCPHGPGDSVTSLVLCQTQCGASSVHQTWAGCRQRRARPQHCGGHSKESRCGVPTPAPKPPLSLPVGPEGTAGSRCPGTRAPSRPRAPRHVSQ